MTDKRTFRLVHRTARQAALEAVRTANEGWTVVVRPPGRTVDQNAAQWPYLEGFSQQLQWPVNGELCWLTPEEWKDVLTSAFERETRPRIAAGFDGGLVMLGKRTSKYSKGKFIEWMEYLKWAAAERNITPVYKNGPRDVGMSNTRRQSSDNQSRTRTPGRPGKHGLCAVRRLSRPGPSPAGGPGEGPQVRALYGDPAMP